MYHDVLDNSAESGFHAPTAVPYKLSLAQFISHMELVARAQAKPAIVSELPSLPDSDYLLLTFDDGGRSAVRIAEILESHGWRGHFFITTSMIGASSFVSAQDIADLARRGHVIGSHSHTHPNIFYDLTEEEMRLEWRTSCSILADIIGAPVRVAAVPGGDMDNRTIATAGECGISHLFTSEPTLSPWTYHAVTCFGRVCVKHDTPVSLVRNWIGFRGFRRQAIIRKCKQLVKRLIGPLYRARMPYSLAEISED